MKKIELLSPAGNFDMLKSAIHNGADAIYLAGNKFGARKFANNFSDDEIVKAIKYAHLYGVKVYVTINTLVKDSEVKDFIDFVRLIHKNGVDAVLMQDLGMINLVRNTFPNLEIHASTQFHNHNNSDLEFLKTIGVKRAVLARELSISEIKAMNVDIEKEVFVHGALCICYSGECLMSSVVMKRSGNRGECAGMCRLPYELYKNNNKVETNGNYLLSPKELCIINNVNDLIESGVDSLKIEGRMKSPEYVGYITKLYRKAIDSYYANKIYKITNKELDNLKVLFNRGFTEGFLFNKRNNDYINQDSPNHQGNIIGNVIDVNNKKIKIKLDKVLNQGDAIRFKESNKGMYANFIYDINDNLINTGLEDQIIYLDNKIMLDSKDTLLKTIDIELNKEILNYELKRIPIKINIEAHKNKNLKIVFNDGKNIVEELGNLIESSINKPITKDEIIEKISKLGTSIYNIESLNIDIDDNLFIPIKEINNIRRSLVEKLDYERQKVNNNFIENQINFRSPEIKVSNSLSLLIDNEKDYLELNDKNIYFYTTDQKLYNNYKNNNNIFLRLPRVIKSFQEFKDEKIITNDIGSIYKYKDKNKIFSDIYNNVANSYTVRYLHELGIEKVGISPELSIEEENELYETYKNNFGNEPNLESFIYGKLELMVLKHCILNNNVNKDKICNVCKENNQYYLSDRNHEKYRIITNNCNNIILNYKVRNRINDINKTLIKNYYVSLIGLDNKKEIIEFIRGWNNDKDSNCRR